MEHLRVNGNAICCVLAEYCGDNDGRVTTTAQCKCNEQREIHNTLNDCVHYVYVTETDSEQPHYD